MTTKILNEKDFNKTADLALAGFLYLFYPLERIERQKDDKRAYFVFKNAEGAVEGTEALISSFWSGRALVDPRRYFEAIRIIKARLYGE